MVRTLWLLTSLCESKMCHDSLCSNMYVVVMVPSIRLVTNPAHTTTHNNDQCCRFLFWYEDGLIPAVACGWNPSNLFGLIYIYLTSSNIFLTFSYMRCSILKSCVFIYKPCQLHTNNILSVDKVTYCESLAMKNEMTMILDLPVECRTMESVVKVMQQKRAKVDPFAGMSGAHKQKGNYVRGQETHHQVQRRLTTGATIGQRRFSKLDK